MIWWLSVLAVGAGYCNNVSEDGVMPMKGHLWHIFVSNGMVPISIVHDIYYVLLCISHQSHL